MFLGDFDRTHASEPGEVTGYYVFCYFMNNGQDGVHYAVSRDGYIWKALNEGKAILAPPVGKKTKLTRDPSITRGPDGVFRLVWTVSWDGRSFGYACSKDLITWQDARPVPSLPDEPNSFTLSGRRQFRVNSRLPTMEQVKTGMTTAFTLLLLKTSKHLPRQNYILIQDIM